MGRLVLAACLGVLAAALLVLAALYFIHGFYLWLTLMLPGWAAALATGGLVLVLALIVVAALSLLGRRRRRPARSGSAAAIGAATASMGLLRNLSPRMIAFGLGVAAALVLLLAEHRKQTGDDKNKKKR